jgi:hypothetical protein
LTSAAGEIDRRPAAALAFRPISPPFALSPQHMIWLVKRLGKFTFLFKNKQGKEDQRFYLRSRFHLPSLAYIMIIKRRRELHALSTRDSRVLCGFNK